MIVRDGRPRRSCPSPTVPAGRPAPQTGTCCAEHTRSSSPARCTGELGRPTAAETSPTCDGEFAIGTNIGLTDLIYNLLQGQEFPGIHIAFGSPLPGHRGAKWDGKAHVDGVLKNRTIYVDDEPVMTEGKFHL